MSRIPENGKEGRWKMSEAWMILWKHYLTRPDWPLADDFYIKAKQESYFVCQSVQTLSSSST